MDKYFEYVEWFKQTYGVNPLDGVSGIRYIDEYVSMRDEYTGLMGDTELVLMLKEKGTYEKHKNEVSEEYSVLTFKEYIDNQKG